ncbi:hypothetical protein HYPSUDRAFT_199911 [Hypholoma sublateritium FD-334 SS-4]|uniref:Uncharacterized protein n=1 Tax=Hypholoma sublateritium (strain FD-334 SS-4) TaxID=945553 RepID=A0A0D2P391_HYPSF|nr:hypothetical protein HYPSUDRAFT_199911 [Hypholoma sublateritium FD-334 SS-4]
MTVTQHAADIPRSAPPRRAQGERTASVDRRTWPNPPPPPARRTPLAAPTPPAHSKLPMPPGLVRPSRPPLQPPLARSLAHPAPAADKRAAAAPTCDAPGAYPPARPAPSQRSADAGRRTRASHSGLLLSSTRCVSMRGRHGWLARCTRAAGGGARVDVLGGTHARLGPRRRDGSATDDGDGEIARRPMAMLIPVSRAVPAPVSNRRLRHRHSRARVQMQYEHPLPPYLQDRRAAGLRRDCLAWCIASRLVRLAARGESAFSTEGLRAPSVRGLEGAS